MSLKPFSIPIIAITPSFKEVVLLFQHLYIASMLRKEEAERWHFEYERERGGGGSTRPYVHKTQNLHPITKSTVSDEITCPPSLYSSTHTGRDMRSLAGVGSAKCQASLHQSAAMTSSSSQWQRERISLLSVCLCMCMHVFVFIFLQYMFCQRT